MRMFPRVSSYHLLRVIFLEQKFDPLPITHRIPWALYLASISLYFILYIKLVKSCTIHN